ncbi:DEAD/DEAH box helicase [Streptomyces caniscabiei]|uniref:DEAD/DEAH box helicase n=1 Tax=Streptomyces caniscabiei TaxID=2746961 RepID=UPI001872D637|nr:DEAD/DEAH box helicase [Streptomyces caniscabiei]MBE4790888.1 DEAD/DEAH box helicase [Streptomyces caniscabiei]MDX2953315.1 DEAD/DEAH box helicase [Streptomyces caniscabiei]MDX2987348.1 DEAD/DEAH box helicase [Streptomyces caniscabiei]MDX3009515.1 DEAD/DEAH box helicase [Streptomyces caniscabiei]
MPEFTPRPYQTKAIQALTSGWAASPNNRLAVVLPTGAGKTVVFANLISEMLDQLDGRRALVLAHREELIEQAAAKVRAVRPDLRVGIVKAQRNDHHDVDVIVASVQTLAVERRRNAIRDIGLIIVDECHHAAAPTYMDVLEHFGAWRGVPTAGFTATMTRQDGGLAEVWQEVVFTLDILEMIRGGYLVDVRGKRVVVDGLNLDKVKTRHGDLQDGQLAQALDDSGAADVVAEAYKEFAADRAGVVFTPTVATAQSMADSLNDVGISATTIWGDMPREARQTALKWYENGDVQVLCNCMVLTEGFDAPWTSCAVIARPTKSAGLYCQMAGRALRLWEGKKDALLLDVMGASTRHKLASIVDLTGRSLSEPKDGRSLGETADEDDLNAPIGSVEWEDVNLFHESPVRWLQTDAGIWFVPLTSSMFLFLVRGSKPGVYRVRRWDTGTGVRPPSPDVEAPLAETMRWTEEQARRLVHPSYLDRAARYRDRAPSPKQRAWCRFNRVPIPAGSTAGDVSDLMDIHATGQALRNYNLAAAA